MFVFVFLYSGYTFCACRGCLIKTVATSSVLLSVFFFSKSVYLSRVVKGLFAWNLPDQQKSFQCEALHLHWAYKLLLASTTINRVVPGDHHTLLVYCKFWFISLYLLAGVLLWLRHDRHSVCCNLFLELIFVSTLKHVRQKMACWPLWSIWSILVEVRACDTTFTSNV